MLSLSFAQRNRVKNVCQSPTENSFNCLLERRYGQKITVLKRSSLYWSVIRVVLFVCEYNQSITLKLVKILRTEIEKAYSDHLNHMTELVPFKMIENNRIGQVPQLRLARCHKVGTPVLSSLL
jgi:hypothetical protein